MRAQQGLLMDLTNVLQASKSTESAMRATGLQTLKVQGALRNTLNTVIRCYTKNNGVLVEVGVRRSSVLNVEQVLGDGIICKNELLIDGDRFRKAAIAKHDATGRTNEPRAKQSASKSAVFPFVLHRIHPPFAAKRYEE